MQRLAPLLAAFALTLSGCGSAPPVPPDRFYRLPPPGAGSGQVLTESSVRVRPLRAEGVHAERAVLFTTADDRLRLEQARYSFWMEGPPRLVQQHLIAYLRERELAGMVTDESVRDTELEIRGQILQFERVVDGGDVQVDVGLELRLDTGYGRPLLIRNYREQAGVAGDSMSDSATAFAGALERIFDAFVADAGAALAAHESRETEAR